MELVLRAVLSLGAVLLLLWVLARLASRRLSVAGGPLVRLVGRQVVGRSASVAVVAVGERLLVVGVTEGSVRLLAELDEDELEETVAQRTATEPRAAIEPRTTTEPRTATEPRTSGRHRSPLDGSALSAETWRQAWRAATSRSSAAHR